MRSVVVVLALCVFAPVSASPKPRVATTVHKPPAPPPPPTTKTQKPPPKPAVYRERVSPLPLRTVN